MFNDQGKKRNEYVPIRCKQSISRDENVSSFCPRFANENHNTAREQGYCGGQGNCVNSPLL